MNNTIFPSIISNYMVLEHDFESALRNANFIFENLQKNPRGAKGKVLKHHIRVVHESHCRHRDEGRLEIDTSPKSDNRRKGV